MSWRQIEMRQARVRAAAAADDARLEERKAEAALRAAARRRKPPVSPLRRFFRSTARASQRPTSSADLRRARESVEVLSMSLEDKRPRLGRSLWDVSSDEARRDDDDLALPRAMISGMNSQVSSPPTTTASTLRHQLS